MLTVSLPPFDLQGESFTVNDDDCREIDEYDDAHEANEDPSHHGATIQVDDHVGLRGQDVDRQQDREFVEDGDESLSRL